MDQTTLMTRMVWALQEAEAIKAWLDPRYACHPAAELQARVQASMAAGRDVGLLVIDILGDYQLRHGELQPFAPHAGGGGARPARAG